MKCLAFILLVSSIHFLLNEKMNKGNLENGQVRRKKSCALLRGRQTAAANASVISLFGSESLLNHLLTYVSVDLSHFKKGQDCSRYFFLDTVHAAFCVGQCAPLGGGGYSRYLTCGRLPHLSFMFSRSPLPPQLLSPLS